MELLERATPLPLAAAHPGVTVLALHGRLWRVTRPDGSVLGYVDIVEGVDGDRGVDGVRGADGDRFRSKRLRPRAQGFVTVGEFWSADEAIDSLR